MLKTTNSIVIGLFVIFSVSPLWAQDEDVRFTKNNFPNQKDELKEARKNLRKGEQLIFNGTKEGFRKAIPHLQAAYDFNPNSSQLNYQLGLAYFNSDKKYKCGEFFIRAYELNEEVSPDILFFVGVGYHLKSDWESAMDYYNSFLQSDEADEVFTELTNKKIEECENGQDLSMTPTRVWIDNLGENVNSEYSDFAPVITADERKMFFTSRREGASGGNMDEVREYYEDIYYAEKPLGEEEWTEAKNLGVPINTKTHDATVGISPDGERLLIYRSKKRAGGDIYYATEDENGDWTKPTAFGDNINSDRHEPDASISFDGKKLYFSSDMEGGYGMHDIYVSEWDEEAEQWGKPENLGPNVNTRFDERGPFIHPDNYTLYFSSGGHNSIGGLDVFTSKLEDGVFSRPTNLGVPINSPDDDVYFVVAGNGRFAYYSSFKEDGIGEKDIYLVTFLGEEKEPLTAQDYMSLFNTESFQVLEDPSQNKPIIRGEVTDISGNPIKTDILVMDEKGNVLRKIQPDNEGNFTFGLNYDTKYQFKAEKEGYETFEKKIMLPKQDERSYFTQNIQLNKPLKDGDVVAFSFDKIFFDFDKATLRQSSYKELDRVLEYLNAHPNIRMEVGGHTDQRGSAAYNEDLSDRRAKVAYKYLIKKGINKNRLEYKGYGETKPIVNLSEITKLPTKGKQDAAYQKNRRTEFTIIR